MVVRETGVVLCAAEECRESVNGIATRVIVYAATLCFYLGKGGCKAMIGS